jgi:hypothetical protein
MAQIVVSFRILISRLINKEARFLKKTIGKSVIMENNKKYQIIRDLMIDHSNDNKESLAVFMVSFKFSGFPLSINKRLSLIPTPFLIAQKGFKRKIWLFNDDGDFMGIYQWASYDDAVNYPKTLIFRILTKRARKGSLNYELSPNTEIDSYIARILNKE